MFYKIIEDAVQTEKSVVLFCVSFSSLLTHRLKPDSQVMLIFPNISQGSVFNKIYMVLTFKTILAVFIKMQSSLKRQEKKLIYV